jgi:hypothetical protein
MRRMWKHLGVGGAIVLALSAVMVASAWASTVNKVITQNGNPVAECNFINVGDKCQIKFTVNGEGEGWKVESNAWVGEKAAERYKKTVGCTVGKVLKDKESCTDVIEMMKKEAGTNNEYCVSWTDEDGGLKNVPLCARLKM